MLEKSPKVKITLSYRAIAKHLNVHPQTVKNQILKLVKEERIDNEGGLSLRTT
jgi:DNA-binding Lrp family transcriptional regulator